jgi:hypothetical protein
MLSTENAAREQHLLQLFFINSKCYPSPSRCFRHPWWLLQQQQAADSGGTTEYGPVVLLVSGSCIF